MLEINNLSDALPILTYYQKSTDYNGMGMHFHCYHELVLVREGEVNFSINGADYLASPNSLVIIREMDKHELSIKKHPYRRYVFTVTDQLATIAVYEPKLLSLFLHSPYSKNCVPLDAALADRLASVFEETIRECGVKKPLWSARVITLITQALIELYRDTPTLFSADDYGSIAQTIGRVQEYIAVHFREKILLDTLAKRFFVSKYHLSRKFHELTGHSFKDYLIRYRMGTAAQLLRRADTPVPEISREVGYENEDHFTRMFHKIQGMPPHQYRLRCRQSGAAPDMRAGI